MSAMIYGRQSGARHRSRFRPLWAGLAAMAFLGLTTLQSDAQPANDYFADAHAIPSAAGSLNGCNIGATYELGEPSEFNNFYPAYYVHSVWFTWTATTNGTATFDTFGSYYLSYYYYWYFYYGGYYYIMDTTLAVYSGTNLNNLTLVAANDDAAVTNLGYYTLDSVVSFEAVAGTTYYIQVDGLFGDQSYYRLNWNLPNGPTTIVVPPPPLGTNEIRFVSDQYTVNENTPGYATVAVEYGGGVQSVVTVDYATSDGTAVAGLDYLARGGTLTFASGQTNQSITIPILDTATQDGSRTLSVTLFNPSPGARVGAPSTAALTILDDDVQTVESRAGEFNFSVTNYTATEFETTGFDVQWAGRPALADNYRNAPGALVTVTRTGGSLGRVAVDYFSYNPFFAGSSLCTNLSLFGTNVADTNFNPQVYQDVSGTLVFDDYQMSSSFIVPINPAYRSTYYNLYFNPYFGVWSYGTANLVLTNARPYVLAGRPELSEDPALIRPTLGPTNHATLDIANTYGYYYFSITNVNYYNRYAFERKNWRVNEYPNPNDQQEVNGNYRDLTVRVVLPYAGCGDCGVTIEFGRNTLSPIDTNVFPIMAGSDYAIPGVDFDVIGYETDPTNHVGRPFTIRIPFGGNTVARTFTLRVFNDSLVEFNEDVTMRMTSGKPSLHPTLMYGTITILSDDQPPGALDREWDPDGVSYTAPPFNYTRGANNQVRAVAVQPGDLKTLLGGDFNAVNSIPRNYLARLNRDGSLDTGFLAAPNTGPDGFVTSILAYPTNSINAGKILIGGGFTSFNGAQRNSLARLNADGTLDPTFTPGTGADGPIRTLLMLPDERIVIVGDFAMYNDVNRNGMARVNADGSLDYGFDVGLGADGPVHALALETNAFGPEKILVGGEFLFFNGGYFGSITRLNIDGSLDFTFDPGGGTGGQPIYALALQTNSAILIAGAFSEVALHSRNNIARLLSDGTLDLTFDPGSGANHAIYSMVLAPDGRPYIGGIFTSYNDTRRIALAKVKENGTLDTHFMDTAYNQFAGLINAYSFQPENFVNAMALEQDTNAFKLILGGSFTNLGGNFAFEVNDHNTWAPVWTRADKRPRYNLARVIGDWGYTDRPVISTNIVGGTNVLVTNMVAFANPSQGPGNVQFAFSEYSVDENAGSLAVTLNRIDGRLGTLGMMAGSSERQAFPGVDYQNTTNRVQWWEHYGFMHSDGDIRPSYTNFMVGLLDDPVEEANETVNLSLFEPFGNITLGGEYIPLGGALGTANAMMTIVDNDFRPGVFTFTAPSYVTNEGAVWAEITVIRTNGVSGSVSVDYLTREGTARAGVDYLTTRSTLSFGQGVTNRSFKVQIIPDYEVEFDETVFLVITNATGGAKLPGGLPTSFLTATLTIVDDDYLPGRLNYSSTTYTNNEADGSATITVARSGGNVGRVSVQYRALGGTAGIPADYTSVSGTLTWDDGDSLARTFTIPLALDGVVDGTKTVNLALFGASPAGALGGRTNATLYLTDADAYGELAFTQPLYVADENGTNVTITVVRSAGIAGTISAFYATSADTATPGLGGDYLDTTGLLVLQPGELSKSFNVSILDDASEDGNKNVTLTLFNPTNALLGALSNATLTLVDDESFNTPAGQLDATFNRNAQANDAVFSLALQTDGRLLIGGNFTNVNQFARYRIARLLADGSIDPSLDAGAGPNGTVRTLAVQRDNKIVVGGFFNAVNQVNRNAIARLNIDGTVDNAFNPGAGADNPVYAVVIQPDDKILIGGSFSAFNGVSRPGVARLDANGKLDAGFNTGSGANGIVYAIALQPDGKIMVGGGFTSFNGQPSLHHLVRLNRNGSVDTSFNMGAGFNAAVQAIAVQPDGKIVVGGSFTSFDGVSRNYLARLEQNGALDAGFMAGVSGGDHSVYAIVPQVDGKLVVAGDFTLFNGVTRNRLTRLNADGTTDPTINFGTGANSFINAALVQPDRKIIIGGGFTTYNDQPRKYLARLHGGSITGSGSIEYSKGVFEVSENGTNAVITLRRLGGTTGQASVDFATGAGTAVPYTHYLPTNGTLTFPQGETQARFILPVIDDSRLESDRVVNLLLGNYVNAEAGPQFVAVLLIHEDESQVSFSAANYSVSESIYSGKATIPVIRTGSTNGQVEVNFLATDGTAISSQDYTATNGILVFLPGETVKNFFVPILLDGLIEGNETVNLVLTNPNPASMQFGLSNAVLSIVDDDFGSGEVSFGSAIYTVDETGTNAVISVVRTNGSTGVISVRYLTYTDTNVTAQAAPGQDYAVTSGFLTFADSETFKTFTIRIFNDALLEGGEVVLLRLSDPTGGAGLGLTNASLTIVDDDFTPGIITFSTNSYLMPEGVGSAPIVLVRTKGTTGTVRVDFATTDGSAVAGQDYVGTNFTVTFADGQSNATVYVPVIGNVLPNFNRTFNVFLAHPINGAALGNPAAALVTIVDDDVFAGAVDLGFNAVTGADGPVYCIAQANDGGMFVGGNFTTINGVSMNRIAKLTTNAIVDLLSFNPGSGASSNVFAIAPHEDGSVFIAGEFTNVNNLVRSRVARLNTNGTVNLAFDPGVGPNGPVYALTLATPPSYQVIRDSLVVGSSDTYITDIGAVNGSVSLNFLSQTNQTNSVVIASVGTNASVLATLLNVNLTNSAVLSVTFTSAPSSLLAIVVNGGITNSNTWSYTGSLQVGLPGEKQIVIGGAFTAVGAVPKRFVARLNQNGTLDTGFAQVGSGLNGSVYAVATLTNGQFLIGGDFTNANSVPLNRIARLNQNGNVDVTFNPGLGADGLVRSLAVQTDGRIVIGGSFTNVDGAPRRGVARLNADGSLDVTFDPGTGPSDNVSSVAIQSDGAILVVGAFTNFNGQPFNRVVRLNPDGSIDSSFNPGTGANDWVHTVALLSARGAGATGANQLGSSRGLQPRIVGGAPTSITNYPYQVALIRVPYNPTNIYSEQFCGGSILDDRWIVTAAHCLVSELPPTVAVAVGVTDLQSPAPGRVFNVDSIIIHPGYNPLTFQNDIALMHLTESIALGTTNYAATPIRPANQFDVAAGLTDPGVPATITGWGNTSAGLIPNYPNILQVGTAPITDVSNYLPGEITPEMIMAGYPAGGVDTCQGDSGGPMVVTNTVTGELILAGITSWGRGCAQAGYPGVYTRVSTFISWILSQVQQAAVVGPERVAIGGQFTFVNGVPRNRIAILDGNGGVDPSFDPGAATHTTVYSLAVYTNAAQLALFGRVVVGGDYLALAGVSANSIARLNTNGVLDRTFNVGSGANGAVRAVAIQTNGQVVIGGLFTAVNATNRFYLARLNEDGSVDPLYNAGLGLNNPVYAIAMQPDQRMVIGGSFTAVGAVPRYFIARIITNGVPDLSFDPGLGPDGPVRAIAVQPDGRILIGGDFTAVAGVPRKHVARLNADGTLDYSFDPWEGPNSSVYAMALQSDGRILIGGLFTAVDAFACGHIARLDADGLVDTTFQLGAGANDYVSSIALQGDGTILVAGGFTTFNGLVRNRLVRLTPEGGLDPTVNFGTGANNFISTVVYQHFDGNIVVGGGFTAFNEVPRNAIARLIGGLNSGSGTLQFSIADYRVAENGSNATVTIVREGSLLGAVSVIFNASGGTATPGQDYLPVTIPLNFAPGQAAQTVSVPLIDNFVTNADRTVFLTLAAPGGGVALGNPNPATLTLLDNDCVLGFSASSFVVNERSPSARITATRAGGTAERVTVQYASTNGTATAGVDYFDVFGVLAFNPGVTAQSFNVPVTNDFVFEGNETVFLSLFNPAGAVTLGRADAILTILEDDVSPGSLSFSTNLFAVSEGAGTVTVTVIRTNGTTGVVSVNYATTNGTALAGADYLATSGVVSFGEGETTKSFTIPILDNAKVDGTRTVQVLLSNPSGGATVSGSLAWVNIFDDDGAGTLAFDADAYSVSEGADNAVIRVVRLDGTKGEVSVVVRTQGGSASAGLDYGTISNVLVFADGQTSRTVSVPIINDTLVEGNETVGLLLSDPTGGATLGVRQIAILNIVDDETQVRFSAPGYTVNEGVGWATAFIVRTGNTNTEVFVDFAAGDGTATRFNDYLPTNGTVRFGPGETNKAIQVRILDDALVEPSEYLNLTLSNPTNATLGSPVVAQVNIQDNDVSFSFASANYTTIEAGGWFYFTGTNFVFGTNVTIPVIRAGDTNVSVSVGFQLLDGTATATNDYLDPNFVSTLDFAPGQITNFFSVFVIDDLLVEGPETVVMSLINPSPGTVLGSQPTAILTIQDNDTSFRFLAAQTNYVVGEKMTNAVITIERNGMSTGEVAVVFTTTTNGNATAGLDYASVSNYLRWAATDLSSRTVTIPIIDDGILEGSETVVLQLSNPTGGAFIEPGQDTAILTIVDDAGSIAFSAASYTVSENATSAVVTLTRTGGTNGAVSVEVLAAAGSATSGVDFLSPTGTVAFGSGELVKTFAVSIFNDTLVEGSETLNLVLANPQGGANVGFPNTAILTIADDEANVLAAGSALIADPNGNGLIDPNERVTLLLALRNSGSNDVTLANVVLLSGNGITSPTGPANYGTLAGGGPSVSRSYSFTAVGSTGAVITATLQFMVGTNTNFATFNYVLGSGSNSVANANQIAINDNGPASPYPATINVSGLSGLVTRVTVTLVGLNHTYPEDIDLALVSPAGQVVMLMSDAGGGGNLNNVTLTFDDAAANSLTTSQITNGTYKPTNIGLADAAFPLPAPAMPYANSLSTFNGINPNGVWSLFIVDDSGTDGGTIASGWRIFISTTAPVGSAADLSVTAVGSTNQVMPGELLTYFVAVTNHGPSTASSVYVTNTLPLGAALVTNTTTGGACTVAGGQVVCSLGSLTLGSGARITIVVSPANTGTITFTSQAVAAETDPNLANNTSAVLTLVGAAIAPSLTAADSGNGQPVIILSGQMGQTYVIEASANLRNWSPISTNVMTGQSIHCVDPDMGLFPQRFYRAVRKP